MKEVVLFDGPFKIIKKGEALGLTFAKIVFEGNEINIKYKPNNTGKIIDYIREWYWHRSKIINPVTGVPEERPLKQWLKHPQCKLFYR